MRKYLGHLPERDPLYQYLKYEIQPQLGGFREHPEYRVFQLNGSNAVYLYEERHDNRKVIGKFFLSEHEHDRGIAARRLEREYDNLAMMRSFGFTGWPHYIARPLGRNSWLNELLVVEYCEGELLSSIISRAIGTRDDGLLFAKLTALAYFLVTFHNRTATGYRVDFNETCSYTESLIRRLIDTGTITPERMSELYWLRDRWREQPKMWEDCQVFAHGDATPENFLFGDGLRDALDPKLKH